MKKKILGIAVMAIVALAAGWNLSQAVDKGELTDLTICNIEALASGEANYLDYNSWYCGSGGMAYCGSPGQW